MNVIPPVKSQVHKYIGTHRERSGYVAVCMCGKATKTRPTPDQAQISMDQHLEAMKK